MPILTAIGTAAVFLYSTLYVGDVEVKDPQDYNQLEVHAFNNRGNDWVFHSKHFQLPPDHYNFEVSTDSSPKQKSDQVVAVGQQTILQCAKSLPPAPPQSRNDNPQISGAHASLGSRSGAEQSPEPIHTVQQLSTSKPPKTTAVAPLRSSSNDDTEQEDKPDKGDKPDKDSGSDSTHS